MLHSSLSDYKNTRIQGLNGRYLPLFVLEQVLSQNFKTHSIAVYGRSVANLPIYGIRIGRGGTRVLMWSQMHGNESTTTRAVLDLIKLLGTESNSSSHLLNQVEILVLPMLNPDGSNMFTRVNKNGIDLNRDASELTQPESKVLRNVFEDFAPHYCFNLHDQRSIFGVGSTGKPAAISFLSPSVDSLRSIVSNRKTAIQLIAAIVSNLESEFKGIIGRFDDSFNENCVGDQFQMAGVPTVLFEAGHYLQDYNRENTRRIIFKALFSALNLIAEHSFNAINPYFYWNLPENLKNFTDIHVVNAHFLKPRIEREQILKFQFEEKLMGSTLAFIPKALDPNVSSGVFSHLQLDAALAADRKRIENDFEISNYLQVRP